jgi:intein/homing endonuclease
MSNQKYTIYQRLTKMFGYNGQPIPTNNSYNFSKNELLKTDSKDEYEKTLLQSQQSQYITDKWAKLDQSLYNQSVYYEANRLAAYYDFESMEFSIHGDTNIATPNGFITIKELADKGRDYEFTVYAYDHNQKKVVPAIARNAHFTRNEMTYKITFDDGSHIIATYGHRFLKRNGEFCVVEELKEGDSMMPFYRKDNSIYTFNVNQGKDGWVDENILLKELKNININFNSIPWDLIIQKALKFKDLIICSKELKIESEVLLKIISDGGFNNWDTFINAYDNKTNNLFYEQKSLIVSIEPFGFVPVYDLTVPGYKNFATDTIFSHNTPEISAALDVFSEESTQMSEKGEMLTIFSESDRIKSVLEDLFKNKLDINTNLQMWARGMCKYGDDFVYLKIDPNDGIIGCQQLPNIEIERIEGGSYLTNKSDNMSQSRELRFAWKNRDMEFQNWEIAHFRLLGDDRKLPYGTCLKYDSRIEIENGYKEIKDIVVGDMVWSFDLINQEKVLSKVLDTVNSGVKETYKLSTKYNSIEVSKEHRILYLNKETYNFEYKNTLDFKVGDLLVLDSIKNNIEKFLTEPIISIEKSGNFETYDIYVENENHNFYANGIVVHNSILDKIRRIWKQLLLAEDAMLIYRTTRAPERRVFKIFVGNMDDKDIEPYVQRVANKFKRDQVVDQKTGQVDMRYNQMAIDQDFFIPVRDISQQNPIETLPGACISLETEIPLLDGRTLKLNEIINEWDNGNKDLWVYSANPLTGELAPGLITWAGVTRKNTDVLKITLDNGEEIISTPDHKFVHRTNGFVEAKDLNIGDSLMPFYRDEEFILKKKYAKKYERVWDSSEQKWIFTHRMVNNFMKNLGLETYTNFDGEFEKEKMRTIHHIDNNRKNNKPSNLTLMESKDHYKYHRYLLWETEEKSIKNREKISKGLKKHIENLTEEQKKERYKKNIFSENSISITTNKLIEWRKNDDNNKKVGKLISKAFTDERKKKHSLNNIENWKNNEFRKKVFTKKQTITFSDEIYNNFLKVFESNLRADKTLKILNENSEFMSLFINLNKDIRSSLTNLNEFTLNHVDKMFKQLGYKNFCDWKKTELKKRGFKNMVAWKYYVDKQNKLYNHKITDIEYLEEKLDTGTITVDNSEIYHNYHTFAIKSGVFIKNSNLGEIQDIEYLQKKMLAALRVPKAFLGFEDVVGEGKSLALMDIRFARTINKVQKSLVHELNKIALLHLLILGFEDELNNFTLSLTNPSSQSDLLKIEQWKEKITLYKDATSDQSQLGILPVSHTWAKKNILGMSESEVLLDLQQQRLERALGFELSNTQQVIKRTRVFDQVDAKYGVSEEERKKIEATSGAENMDSMGGDLGTSPAPTDGGEALSEEINLFTVLKDKDDLIFDNNKSTNIINELNDKIKDIIK